MYNIVIILIAIISTISSMINNILWCFDCCRSRTRQRMMEVSRETPDVATKPRCHDLTNIHVFGAYMSLSSLISINILLNKTTYGHNSL